MQCFDLLVFALSSITSPNAISPEASYRRAISASYYALFHRLAEAGADAFANAGPATTDQVKRAFKHGEMRTVCERYRAGARGRTLASPLNNLVSTPSDPRLLDVAESFIKLQDARETADYDLTATTSLQEATEVFQLARQALTNFDAIERDPATRTFLTALLMADRWKRGG